MSDSFEIPAELRQEWPDPGKLKEEILASYTKHTGQALSSPHPTDSEMNAVVAWLNQHATQWLSAASRRRPALIPAFSATLSAKVSNLMQFHCPICGTKKGLFPVKVFPIRIRPESKQAISQQKDKLAAFEAAIRHRFRDEKTPFEADKSICLLLVFVVRRTGHQKDLDNMAKAIVDATKRVLFGDDRKIDHLNIIRINSPREEYVCMNIRPTILNEHNDVLVPRMIHSWAGAQVLDLKDFIAPKP
jgi:Holliday junction resolvase RusA-like endonuclease